MRIVTNGLHDLLLPGLNYAVFGLGNKTYEHYNAMGIYVDKLLEELGGKRIHELGKRENIAYPIDHIKSLSTEIG